MESLILLCIFFDGKLLGVGGKAVEINIPVVDGF
jgi:hypothetical protein